MKKFKLKHFPLLALAFLFLTCASNPLTGKSTMAFIPNSSLFPMAFQEYSQFLSENSVIKGTADAQMVERVGKNIREAAEKWLSSEGHSDYLNDYEWEYNLVDSKEVNAWCMPGGKIVVYTGILPLTRTEDGLAAVMGHEVSHALLNHGQQRMSAGLLQQLGAIGVALGAQVAGLSEDAQSVISLAYSLGSTYGGVLPFSRSNESEADHYGLILMTIAGYNPEESVPFWERMAAMGGGTLEFLSTHPVPETRIRQLQGWIPEAREKAKSFGK
ncbi:MAG: M48 family metallopeptidase [Treponema sp.]|jgi:predicted Zn-dependent protease|nr:M48 family metallopeptidase [Treponema sp.]